MNVDTLFSFYTNVQKSKIYEWCSIGNGIDHATEFLKYKENYEYLLNTCGQPQKIGNIKNKGKYKDSNNADIFYLARGLNFGHSIDMYNDDNIWGVNSNFVRSVKQIFKDQCKYVTEEFISIPQIMSIPGHKYNGNIINLNFYRQGMQFDYIVNQIHSKFECKTIMEIGAGSGIMAHFQKKYNKNSKYIILDIPHALLIQYTLLTKLGYNVLLLDEEKADNINSIIKESDFDILLILPHHISKINPGVIDLTLNFDSLVEMNTDTITHYLDNIKRISKLFYSVNKTYNNWNTFKNKINQFMADNTFTLLDYKEQAYGTMDYHFYIALSKDYYQSFFKNNSI